MGVAIDMFASHGCNMFSRGSLSVLSITVVSACQATAIFTCLSQQKSVVGNSRLGAREGARFPGDSVD